MISRQGQIRRQKECAIPLPLPFGGSGPKDLGQGTLSNTVSVIFVNYELFKMAEEGGRLCHGMKMSCVSWTATTTPQPLPMSVVLVTSHFGASVCGKSWTRFYFMHQRAWILMKLSTCMDGCRLRKKCGSTFSADLSLPYICSILFYARKASQIHAHWQA